MAAFAFALFVLSQAGTQVAWNASKPLVNQPGFWPVMAVCGMVLFGALHLTVFLRQRFRLAKGAIISELSDWLRALEFVGWFLVYVWAVPKVGYLGTTLVFCVLLTARLGYRSKQHLLCAAATGLAVVVVFKTFLSVKIPGGAVYELLPAALRNFMIVYF